MEIRYIERESIIEINRKIIEEWNNRHPEQSEYIAVSTSRLDEVSEIVKNAGNDARIEDQIVIKAANLLGGLAWTQAFSGANKRTAILSCTIFLRRHGLRLTIPQSHQRELRKMLFDVQEQRDAPRQDVVDKIILYIKENIKPL